MRRLLAIVLAVGAASAAAIGAGGRGDDGERSYEIELDNAFGLVTGGDVRVAGVNAGQVHAIRLDKRSLKALVEVRIRERGFGSLRRDAFCESRPQSPLGEYFLDCLPGKAREEIPPGGRIPVRQTASTIPPDLIQNIMRRPYRERFRLIVNELGAGLAGRPAELNEAIRRGVPALRQSSRLLEILAEHNRTIRDMVGDADTVMRRLSANRRNVGKFVVEARDTAAASAERDADIQQNFRKLPRFLAELRPTMAALGETADEQTPVLRDLSASAGQLRRFFDQAEEFAIVSRPAIDALGKAAPTGRSAVKAARPQVAELRRYAEPTPDLGRNLRITLEDFDDPARAVEPDPRSPGGKGYSGTQAVLRYIMSQSLTNNAFDEIGYMVRAAPHTDRCSPYADALTVKEKGLEECRAWLGPTQPGVNVADPSGDRKPTAAERRSNRRRSRARTRGDAPATEAPQPEQRRDGAAEPRPPEPPRLPDNPAGQVLEDLLDDLGQGQDEGPPVPDKLLDYLLGP